MNIFQAIGDRVAQLVMPTKSEFELQCESEEREAQALTRRNTAINNLVDVQGDKLAAFKAAKDGTEGGSAKKN
jgi:hypothetical protein